MDVTKLITRLAFPTRPLPYRDVLIAALCAGAAAMLRLGLETLLHGYFVWVTFWPAVIVATVWAGWRAGMLTLAVSLLAGWFFSGALPQGDFGLRLLGVGMFTAFAGPCVALLSFLRDAVRRLEQSLEAQHQASADLVISDTRLKLAQEVGGLGVFDWNLVTGVGHWSEGFYRNWGMVDREAAPGREILLERIHPEDRARVRAANDHALATGSRYVEEYRVFRDDGEMRWIAVQGEVFMDDAGKPVRVIGINHDVTERKAAESVLRESEARFRAIADSAPSPIWVTGAGGGVQFANQAMAEFFGATPEDLSGDAWKDRIHPDDIAGMLATRNAAHVHHTPYVFEVRFQNKDGQWRWTRAFSKPRHDLNGAFLGYVGIAFDVTEIREGEAALRESEERFRLIADAAPALMWISVLGGRREFVNKAYCAFAGLSYEETINLDWRERIHAEDIARIIAEQQAGEASMRPFMLEARYRRADGAWRWLRSFSQPRFGRDGEHIGFIGVGFDVTEEKLAQSGLERINELLEERVEAALAEKAQAEAALLHIQKLEAVGRLTGGVAHDFNNLLTVVIGALDMILKHPEDPEKLRRMAAAAMAAAARRGERLTHQLLAFSRRQPLRPEACVLDDLIRESEPLLRRALGESIAFEVKLGCDGAAVRVDPAQFEAAVINLVVNARDATADGDTVAIQTELNTLRADELPEVAAGRYVCLKVCDSGAGMTAEILSRVFEPFFTTKPVGKGTGLGLSQVYGFARQSGGAASVQSEPGEGTTITLYLPLLESAAQTAPVGRAEPEAPASGVLEILLVEDDHEVAAIAEAMLRGLGHEVVRAETGEQALERLGEARRVDLLLSDIVMPGVMNGVELARRAADLRPGLKVLLTSGYAGEAFDEALEEAPWPFLRKPYSEAELSERIAAALATGPAARP